MRTPSLLAVALLVLTGCVAWPSVPLAGTSWVVTGINGAPPVSGSRPTMAFTEDRVAAVTGCNSLSAGYTLSGTTITISEGAMTAMACADDLMAQESEFTAALAKVTRLILDGDNLQLQDGTSRTLFTLTRAVEPSPRPLEGTTWQLDTITKSQTASSVVAGSSVTLHLSDGTLSGKACNTFRGPVIVDGARLQVGPLATTKMACPTEDLAAQEQAVLSVLAPATSYRITGSRLELADGTGNTLGFTAQ